MATVFFNKPSTCPSCKYIVSEGSKFCTQCGSPLATQKTFKLIDIATQEEFIIKDNDTLGTTGDIPLSEKNLAEKAVQFSIQKEVLKLKSLSEHSGVFIELPINTEYELKKNMFIKIGDRVFRFD
ncbi:MAG: zinc ribbon domain-containing protein [Leptospiraceae bacterium]|nr:zinc ribbon domain-containing protein [Leptospiraceae bacterium]MCP5501555.1 zinc ribbon domain-containing protein [Leptospiraceae bacterium]